MMNTFKTKFTFVDLFSGIGGFRIPLNKLGGKCLGFSEIDNNAIKVYKNNFIDLINIDETELGSITNINEFPFDVDLVVGGVPCQSWSVAGKLKGFEDPRGQLWFDSIRVIDKNRPRAFIFENVKGLYDPRNRDNLMFLLNKFEELDYNTHYNLLNSSDFGLPQNRERVFIVGIHKSINLINSFEFPVPTNRVPVLADFIDGIDSYTKINKKKFNPNELFGSKIPFARNKYQKLDELNDFFIFCDTRNGHTTIHSWDIKRTTKREKYICLTILKNRRKKIFGNKDGNPISFQYLKKLISNLQKSELDKLIDKNIINYKEKLGYGFVNSKNSSGINGIYRIFLPNSNIFSTLTATGTKDKVALTHISGNNVEEYKQEFIDKIYKDKRYRDITPREAARLQGFPDWFKCHKNPVIAKRQFGNAVPVPVVLEIVKKIIHTGVFKSRRKNGRKEEKRVYTKL